jgi:prophage tail gpP-like protein
MPKPQETVVIIVNGERFEFWEGISITRRVGDPFSLMHVRVAEIGDLKQGYKSLRLKLGDQGTATLAGRLAMTGFVTQRQVVYNKQFHGIEIVFSTEDSRLGVASVDLKPGQYKNENVWQIGQKITSPHGITFKQFGNVAGADKVFERFSEHPGESKIQCLSRMCEMRNLFLVDDQFGNLLAGRASGGSPIALLEEGRNIEAAQLLMSVSNMANKITVAGHNFGNDAHPWDAARDVAATANIVMPGLTNVPIYLQGPLVMDKQDAVMFADHMAAQDTADAINCLVTLPGWLCEATGELWLRHIFQTITIYSPMLFPDDRMDLVLRGVTHTQNSSQGTVTVLDLCLPSGLGGQSIINAPGAPQVQPAQPDPSDTGPG